MDFLDTHHITYGLVPVADFAAGGVTTDVISMENYNRCTFIILTGAIEDAGISNLCTVLACDDATPSNTSTMAFRHRTLRWSTSNDTWLASTAAAAAGYNLMSNNAVANCIHVIDVTADEVSADGGNGYQFVQLSIAETANKTITGAVLVILSEPRYASATPTSAIS